MSLRLLSYNIRFGGAGREKEIAAVINACEADVVILEEAIRPDVVRHLASACGMKAWGAVPGDSLAFLSKYEVAYQAWHELRMGRRRYLELQIAPSGIRIFGVHLSAIHSNLTERRRMLELRSLLRGIQHHGRGFHLVAGDFNTLGPGEQLDLSRLPFRLRAFVWLTGRKIRWTTIQLMLDSGYVDVFRKFDRESEGFTFPTWDPHVRLDYLFVPAEFTDRVKQCRIMRDIPAVRAASDHFPLLGVIEAG